MIGESVVYPRSLNVSRCAALLLAIFLAPSCTGQDSSPPPLTADMPLHLEEHLDVATIVGSELPVDAPTVMEWHFDKPQEDWKPVVPWNPPRDPVQVTQLDDALRVTPTDGPGGLVLEVPDWNYEDLAHLVVRARTSDDFRWLDMYFNRRERADSPVAVGGGSSSREAICCLW